ncbi:uncharacterized protein ACRADG_000469 [Cochliomyia hominivorax]
MDWTRSEILQLISLYREYECLWNPIHEDYNNIDTKLNAWLDIANACGKEMDDVKRKVKNLRSAYVSEKRKCEASQDMGVNYRPNLFYYKEFDFLDSIVVLRKNSLPTTSNYSPMTHIKSKTRDKIADNDKERDNKTKDKEKDRSKHKIVKMDRKSLRDSKFSSAIDAIVASVKQQQQPVIKQKTTALHLQQLPAEKAMEAMAAIYQLVAKKMLDSVKKSRNVSNTRRTNGVISFETMSP